MLIEKFNKKLKKNLFLIIKPIINPFKEILKKYIYGFLLKINRISIYIYYWNLLIINKFLIYNLWINFNKLTDISGQDAPYKQKRFEINYNFWNIKINIRLILKTFVNNIPIISLKNIFYSSEWYERELWDMFGIRFIFNNDLRRILTDYSFKGFPLRKDFPLAGYIELKYDYFWNIVIFLPCTLNQDVRRFKWINNWL